MSNAQALPTAILKRLDKLETALMHTLTNLTAKVETLSDAARGQNDRLLTTDQAAQFLHVSYQTLLRDQSIPHTKDGKRRLYLHSDLLAWASTRKRRGFTLSELETQASLQAIRGMGQ
jgi:excisionase family DNA binding protein